MDLNLVYLIKDEIDIKEEELDFTEEHLMNEDGEEEFMMDTSTERQIFPIEPSDEKVFVMSGLMELNKESILHEEIVNNGVLKSKNLMVKKSSTQHMKGLDVSDSDKVYKLLEDAGNVVTEFPNESEDEFEIANSDRNDGETFVLNLEDSEIIETATSEEIIEDDEPVPETDISFMPKWKKKDVPSFDFSKEAVVGNSDQGEKSSKVKKTSRSRPQSNEELEKKFKCAHCTFEFNDKTNLKSHLLIHSNIKLFKCSKCNYECNEKDNLKKHMLRHGNMLMLYEDMLQLFNNEHELLGFLLGNNLLINDKFCINCKTKCEIRKKTKKYCYRCLTCWKFYASTNPKTFMHNIHIDYKSLLELIFLFVNNINVTHVKCFVNISEKTSIDYYNIFREVCLQGVLNSNKKLGGPGKIVEVDESVFSRRKFNKDRSLNSKWVVGGIERESGHIFLVPVVNRTSDTLSKILKEYIAPGTTVITDNWKGYKNLNKLHLNHLRVNHSLNFVNPETGAHTNTIECEWSKIKSKLPKNVSHQHFLSYLSTYVWLKENKGPDIFIRFIEMLGLQIGLQNIE